MAVAELGSPCVTQCRKLSVLPDKVVHLLSKFGRSALLRRHAGGVGAFMKNFVRRASAFAGHLWREFAGSWRRALISFCAGLVVLALIRIPVVERSIIGEPDREMLSTAFKLTKDAVVGDGPPAVLLDIDDATLRQQTYVPVRPGREPTASAPRGMLADLLKFILATPSSSMPGAVIVDVDIGAPAPDDPQGSEALRQALENWAATPHAPRLIIAREAFAPAVLGLEGESPTLPQTDYDPIVAKAQNIHWSTVRVLADLHGTVREFLPFQCVVQNGRVAPLYSAALLASEALSGKPPAGSPAALAFEEAPKACANSHAHAHAANHHMDEDGEVIHFQLSLAPRHEEPAWALLPASWPGFKTCGADSDASVFRRVSASDILAAGPDAGREFLCRRLAIIGGTNSVANDFQQTPLHMMSGPMILTNAVRGISGTDGGLRQAGFPAQIAALLCISLMITFGFAVSRALRERYHHRKSRASHWAHHVVLLPLNPVVINLLIGLAAHWVGVAILLVTLKYGFWGFMSAPAFGAAVAETIQEFSE